jgi:hypothetical protein
MHRIIISVLFSLMLAANASGANLTLSSFADDWLEPWEHEHYNKAPFVHLFNLEPAFLDRDLFFDYKITNAKDEKEREVEFEVEWALTKRIGLIFEAPYRILEERGSSRERGIGDFGIGTRFLLVRTDDSILSFNIGFEFPTGSKSKGLTEDQYVLNSSFSYWKSLSTAITWNAQIGFEQGLEDEEKSLTYKTAFTYSFNSEPSTHIGHDEDHECEGSHFPQGMLNLMLEFSGRNDWSGNNHTSELLFGTSYLVTSSIELRAAYEIPLQKSNELDNSIIFSVVYHF